MTVAESNQKEQQMQQVANDLRRKCWIHLQSINAADPDESLDDWRRLKKKTREAWLWIARELTGDNPE
jgi:hypothetical protein